MDEMPERNQAEMLEEDSPQETGYGLSRRDFMKVAAIITGSMLLTLSRCKVPFDDELEIPPDFKRFVLVEQSPTVATEKIVVALGSQCPDLSCALWPLADQEFQFFETVDQITSLYVQDDRSELIWID